MNFLDTSRFLDSYNQNLHPLLVKMAEDDPKDSAPQPAPAPDQAPEVAPQPQGPAVKVIPPELDENQQKQLKDLLRQVGQVQQDKQPQQPLAPKFVPFVASATTDQPEVPVYTRREGLSPYSVSPTSAGGDNVYTFQNMQFRERPVVVQSPFVQGIPTVDLSPSEQKPYIPKWRLGQQAARERYRIENALKDIGDQGEALKTGAAGYIIGPPLSSGEDVLSELNASIDDNLQDNEGTVGGDSGLDAKQEGTDQGAGQANAEGGNQAAPGDTPQATQENKQENKADEAGDKAKPDGDKNKDTGTPKAPSQPPAQPSGEAQRVVPADVEKWQGTTDYWTKVIENYRRGANDMFNTYMRLRSEYPAYSRRPMQLSVYGMVNMLPLVSMSDYNLMADAYIRYWNRVYGKQAQPVSAQAAQTGAPAASATHQPAQQVAPQPSAPVGAAGAATETTPGPAPGATPGPAPGAATGGTNQSGAQAANPSQPASQ